MWSGKCPPLLKPGPSDPAPVSFLVKEEVPREVVGDVGARDAGGNVTVPKTTCRHTRGHREGDLGSWTLPRPDRGAAVRLRSPCIPQGNSGSIVRDSGEQPGRSPRRQGESTVLAHFLLLKSFQIQLNSRVHVDLKEHYREARKEMQPHPPRGRLASQTQDRSEGTRDPEARRAEVLPLWPCIFGEGHPGLCACPPARLLAAECPARLCGRGQAVPDPRDSLMAPFSAV